MNQLFVVSQSVPRASIAEAQQQPKLPKIGFFSGSGDRLNPAASEKSF
jgi:hypothetical protein